jgi:hypothetical protein
VIQNNRWGGRIYDARDGSTYSVRIGCATLAKLLDACALALLLAFTALAVILHRRIVPDVARTAHRTDHAMISHQALELLAGVLAAAIGFASTNGRRRIPRQCRRLNRVWGSLGHGGRGFADPELVGAPFARKPGTVCGWTSTD